MNREKKLHIVVAMTKERVIGSGGTLPWDLPEDLRLFRQLTLGQTVIMGRGTCESIGRPLDGRTNIVISSEYPERTGITIFPTFAAGLDYARTLNQDIFCIGGGEIFRQALPLAMQLHISWVDNDCRGDTLFPEFDLDQWRETARRQYAGFTHISYDRKQ